MLELYGKTPIDRNQKLDLQNLKNTNKTNDKQPEFSGLVKVNGEIYRLAIWDNGKNLSLKFQSKDEYQQYSNKSSQPKTVNDLQDDVPFQKG